MTGLAVLSLCSSLGAVIGVAQPAGAAQQIITSAGPLTQIIITDQLNCQVAHTGDASFEFYSPGDQLGDCGSLLVVGSTLYGPTTINAGQSANPRTPWTPVSQTPVTGAGTPANPYTIVTVVAAGTTGVQLTETDSYVVGQEAYRTDVQLANTSPTAQNLLLYRAGDCFLQSSDFGFGQVGSPPGAIACTTGAPPNPGRIEQWLPITPGSHYYEQFYDTGWHWIGTQQPFPDTCICTTQIDNWAGLSWSTTLAPGATATYSHLTTFSPTGNVPLVTTKTADNPTAAAGGSDGYTITISNSNPAAASLNSIFDSLPSGFSYVLGTTTGVTTNNPSVSGQTLSWAGPFTVPGESGSTPGTVTLHFGVTASSVPGDYFNQAGGMAPAPETVAPTGPTAKITVSGGDTPPSCALTSVIPGPPKQILITVQDSVDGLQTITAPITDNASVPIPAFTVGTTAPVVVTATKIDQTMAAQVALQVTDTSGNVTNCDPILTTVTRGTAAEQVFTGVAKADHLVQITNGRPGLRTLTLTVNGRRFRVSLTDGASRTIDVSSAMHARSSNRITVVGRGPRGASADVMILG